MTAKRPSLRSVRAEPASRPRRGAPDETRRRLLAAAGVLLNRDGYDGTDSNRIAREAGYAPGTFYKHFADKKEALVAVYAEWVAEEWRGIEALLAGELRGEALARAVVALVIDLHRRWRGLRRALRSLASHDADVRRAYVAQRSAQLDTLARLGSGRRTRAADALLLYTLERTADAIADGEPDALGIDEQALVEQLVALLSLRATR